MTTHEGGHVQKTRQQIERARDQAIENGNRLRDQMDKAADALRGGRFHEALSALQIWDRNGNGGVDADELADFAGSLDLDRIPSREFPQPAPIPNSSRPVWELVVEDMCPGPEELSEE